jgi:hypothetical protein
MSSIPTSIELNDSKCEKGHVTQQPPIPCAVSKAGLLMMTTRGTVKIKTTEGEHKQAILGDGAVGEEYIMHLMAFDCIMEKKEHKADLAEAARAVLKASLKKHAKVPKGGKVTWKKPQDSSKSRLLKESSLQPRSSRAPSRASPMTSFES